MNRLAFLLACGISVGLAAAILVPAGRAAAPAAPAASPHRSPLDVAYSPQGGTLAVSDHTAAAVVLIDAAAAKVKAEVKLSGQPAGVAWAPDGQRLYVAECGAGTVAEVDVAGAKVVRRLAVGPRPMGVALAAKRGLLVAANSGTDTVSVVDLASGKEKARVGGLRAPHFVAVTPDEKTAVVGNLFPATPASDAGTSAAVSLVDLDTGAVAAHVRLPPNSALVRQVTVSPDGRRAYAVHTLGRTTLPTTQLERGWVNTNALTVIDLAAKKRLVTVLLDQLSEGAADPWGAAVSRDARTLWVTLAGVHQLARVDLAGLEALLRGETPEGVSEADLRGRGYSRIWFEIKADPAKREALANDLAALYGAGLLKRTRLGGKGPRGIAVSPDGKQLAVAAYYAGSVLLADAQTGAVAQTVALGPPAPADLVRRGEMIFHDATHCFQHWLSCATCHPDGRADGLNWDLLNDGIGNPKNTRSLVLAHRTPPMMSLGVRDSMEIATAAGFRFILFREPAPQDLEAVQAYLRALAAAPSPYLAPGGQLSEKAKRGKAVFESRETGCTPCHPAPLFTNQKMYDVGTRGELDRSDEFDTPTLIELWRTAPYLHDGSARTLQEVLTTRNEGDRHGKTSHLSKEDVDALVEYLNSL